MQEYEFIDISNYIQAILRRKFFLWSLGILGVALALMVSFFAPKVYQVDTVLEIGKIGNEFLEDPASIGEQVRIGLYTKPVRERLGIPEEKLPKIQVQHRAGSPLLTFIVRSSEPQIGKQVLEELYLVIGEAHERLFRLQKDPLERDIALREDIITNRKNTITRVSTRVNTLEKERRDWELQKQTLEQTLSATNTSISESQLILSNIITIQQITASITGEIETLNLKIQEAQEDITFQENKIAELRERREQMKPTAVIKEPTILSEPVYPKPLVNSIIGGIGGLFIGILLAVGKEWWRKGIGTR